MGRQGQVGYRTAGDSNMHVYADLTARHTLVVVIDGIQDYVDNAFRQLRASARTADCVAKLTLSHAGSLHPTKASSWGQTSLHSQ